MGLQNYCLYMSPAQVCGRLSFWGSFLEMFVDLLHIHVVATYHLLPICLGERSRDDTTSKHILAPAMTHYFKQHTIFIHVNEDTSALSIVHSTDYNSLFDFIKFIINLFLISMVWMYVLTTITFMLHLDVNIGRYGIELGLIPN